MTRATWSSCPTPSCSTSRSPSTTRTRRNLRSLGKTAQRDSAEGVQLFAVQLAFLSQQITEPLRGEVDMDPRVDLGRERTQMKGVIRLIARVVELQRDVVQLHVAGP